MEKYLNAGIKDIIKQFPEVDKILSEYNIGCAPCNVGSCLLKDIVEIHNLAPETEKELLTKIAKVIYPGKTVNIPIRKAYKVLSAVPKSSPPIKKLMDEHTLIKRWAALIPLVAESIDLNADEGKDIIMKGVDFIRNFADKYHHAKEENILFKQFDENLDIIKTMHADHEDARAHVRAIVEGVEEKNKEKVVEHLTAYAELLTEHIKKEDEILYPWMDREFSDKQVGLLFAQFSEVDEQFGDAPKKYEEFICRLEKKFKHKEVVT